jgi:hyperosmotically inducible protein
MRGLARTLGAGLLMIGLLSGCQTLTGKTTGQNVDDAAITAAVKSKLAAEKAGTLSRVDVDTNLGVVQLNGVVESDAVRNRVVALARQVEGVRSVQDNLRVQAPGTAATTGAATGAATGTAAGTSGTTSSRSAGQVVDDAMITAAVKAKLVGDAAANLVNVDVDTREGTVTLTGTVRSEEQRARAVELARGVDGVRAVINSLRVQGS